MNVIITHSSRSAISEIFGYVSLAYFYHFNEPLLINFEANYFEATRSRRPLLEGWNDVINADPQILLDRGYDKVIHVNRDLLDLAESLALYHRRTKSKEDIIKLAMDEPRFFANIKKKWDKLQKEIDDSRFLRITLNEWNNFTFQTFNKLLDFLEFPKEKRPFLIPVKSNKDFEGYSCSFLEPEYEVCENIEVIRRG